MNKTFINLGTFRYNENYTASLTDSFDHIIVGVWVPYAASIYLPIDDLHSLLVGSDSGC